MTGLAMISLGAAAGFTGGMLNPFTVGIAQTIAEVPVFSAFGYRLAVYAAMLGFSIFMSCVMLNKSKRTRIPV